MPLNQAAKQKFSETGNNLELEKYCNEEVPIIKTQKSIPDEKPIRLPNRPSSGTELEIYLWKFGSYLWCRYLNHQFGISGLKLL